MDEEEALLLCCALLTQKSTRNRSEQTHPINQSRERNGEYHRLVQELKLYESHFFTYFRMTKEIFKFLLASLRNVITEPITLYRHDTINTEQKLAITLR